MTLGTMTQTSLAAPPGNEERAWKVYTNARALGFSVRYPENWHLGQSDTACGVGERISPSSFTTASSQYPAT